ncbi:IMP dehydrogenase [Novimethylophilus kurashikiensis]|uniref:IMP dehydrogenase n=1 Tax=Novimethylophilus kurashikiensis TaxID=1825523 RepID=A0A2R5FCJ4_9PROT|nr:hypothetical protein [Novimethylophilus kurashikiensis]GBG14364.1 IMP dehydrogenase [Novimethylophilus kurashikiensis]
MDYINRPPGKLISRQAMTLPATATPDSVDIINCCVPYWDERKFISAGGQYKIGLGYYIPKDAYLHDFEEWLPRKWQYRGEPPVPVLLPDMLPSSVWEANLRHMLSDEEWDRLRKFCYQAAGNTCVACGSRGEPHIEAHEAWSFDERTGIQKLKALLSLCPTCHKAKHLGFAQRIGLLPQVLDRLKWLNDWDDEMLKTELAKVQARQEELSKRNWTLDLSFLRTYGVR